MRQIRILTVFLNLMHKVSFYRVIKTIGIYLLIKITSYFKNEMVVSDIFSIKRIYNINDPAGFSSACGIRDLDELIFTRKLTADLSANIPLDNYIDIGSAIGYFTLPFAIQVHKGGGVIHSFEPNPFNIELQRKTLGMNGVTNIVLNNVGVADTSGMKTFYYEKGFKGYLWGSFVLSNAYLPGTELESLKIKIITIDDYVTKNIFSDLSFIKMDTEGNEYPILTGMEQTLNRFKPIIMMEMSLSRMVEFDDNRFLKTLELLKRHEYEIYVVNNNKLEKYYWPYQRVMNWFAIPKVGLNPNIDKVMSKHIRNGHRN